MSLTPALLSTYKKIFDNATDAAFTWFILTAPSQTALPQLWSCECLLFIFTVIFLSIHVWLLGMYLFLPRCAPWQFFFYQCSSRSIINHRLRAVVRVTCVDVFTCFRRLMWPWRHGTRPQTRPRSYHWTRRRLKPVRAFIYWCRTSWHPAKGTFKGSALIVRALYEAVILCH